MKADETGPQWTDGHRERKVAAAGPVEAELCRAPLGSQ